MSNAQDWQDTLHDLSRRRQHAHSMGGEERLAKHHGKGEARCPGANRSPPRSRHLPGVRHPRRRRDRGGRFGGGRGSHRRNAGDGGRGGLHHVGRQHWSRRECQALPARRTCAPQQDPVGDVVGGGRFPSRGRRTLWPHPPDRSDRAGTVFGQGSDHLRCARSVGGARRAGGSGLRLLDHERPGCDLHRRPSGRERSYR